MYVPTHIFEGGNNNGGLFWSNDQASRQLAAHYLQTNNQLNTSNWFGQGHLTFPPSNQTQTSEAGQLPLSVPPGYKLAQDSLTGDILLIPSGKILNFLPATSEAGQLPLSVPPGYKLAQESLTGDILLIPSGKTYFSFPCSWQILLSADNI